MNWPNRRRSGATRIDPPRRPAAEAAPEAPKLRTERPQGRAATYIRRHAQVLFFALGQLARAPFSTLLTAAVIGIALALPAGLHVLLQNGARVLTGWEESAQVSLYLRTEVSDAKAEALVTRLRNRSEFARVTYISPAQALADFKAASGLGAALDALGHNPLPGTVVLVPIAAQVDPRLLEPVVASLRELPEVELAQLDLAWVHRLRAAMALGERAVMLLTALLAIGVVLVTGNTIRLAIQNRRAEIEIAKLVGATNGFIRRPFLYSGALQGLLGGTLACVAVTVAVIALRDPAAQLSASYQSDFALQGLDLGAILALLGGGAALGLAGSWVVVGIHLRRIEPT